MTAAPPRPRRRLEALGLDQIELGALVALCGLSVLVLAMLSVKGRPLSGADGLLASDQLQYFAWIREASHHLLIGNRFDLAPGDRDRSCTRASRSRAAYTRSGSRSR